MDVAEAIRARRSVRRYKSTPIPDETLQNVLNAARLAPSAENMQPWRFVVVRDEDAKRELASACNNQTWIAEAPVIIAACGVPDEAGTIVGGYVDPVSVDVSIALTQAALEATSEGLGTCWVTAFSEERVKSILNIPPDVRVVALTPLGYPDEMPEPSGRKHLSQIVCYDKYE
ncbi:MAG: nitroreductase [Methanomassiliicoccales archaeon]|nr:MAG: nitroreductase [Methanomassiliicoccales archaeon]